MVLQIGARLYENGSMGMRKLTEREVKQSLEIAKRLSDLIDARDVSYQRIADACDVTRAAVYQWAASGQIKATHIPELARLLGVSTDYLLTGNGIHEPEVRARLDRVEQLPEIDQRRVWEFADALLMASKPKPPEKD